jgi:iduronate 2-sulfatase
MKRREFLKGAGVGLPTALTVLPRSSVLGSASAPKRPNVLFISVDDLRPELGCYGTPIIRTPAIDRLAASGVRFSRAYCQSSVCNPSRVSLMTGLRPDSAKVWDLLVHFRETVPDIVTLPEHFRRNGYRAMAFGKIFHATLPDRRSWDVPTYWPRYSSLYSKATLARIKDREAKARAKGWSEELVRDQVRGPAIEVEDVPDNRRWDGEIAEQAMLSMVGLARSGRPFFLGVGFFQPHLPFVAPKRYWDLYDRARIPEALNPFLPKGMPSIAMNIMTELRVYSDFAAAPRPTAALLPEARRRALKHGYYASVSFIDAQVGRLLDLLKRLGIAGNTIVVFSGDNGWKLGEHGSWCKSTNYEIDNRCPLIIRDPGRPGNGRASDARVEFVDLYTTLCEAAGLPLPAHLEGRSLAGLLNDPASPGRDAAFSQIYRLIGGRHVMSYSMRTDRYRYIEWRDWPTGATIVEELYDHRHDPEENDNLAVRTETAGVRADLRSRLLQTCPIQRRSHPAIVRATASDIAARLELVNELGEAAVVFELDAQGARQEPKTLKPGERRTFETYLTHPFAVESVSGDFYRLVTVSSPQAETVLRKSPRKR